MLDPLGCLEKWRRKFGDPFTIGRAHAHPWIFFGQPEAIKTIFRSPPETFVEPRGGDKILKAIVGNKSLLRLAGESHREERRMFMPHFQMARLIDRVPEMLGIFASATRKWCPGHSFQVRPFTQGVTLQVICDILFGPRGGADRVAEIETVFSRFMDYLSPLPRSMALTWCPMHPCIFPNPWSGFRRRLAPVDRLVREEIAERRARRDAPDGALVGVMIHHRYPDGSNMPDVAIRDEVMTMLFAGHETTASALAWALYLANSESSVQTHLLEEINALAHDASAKDILSLPYLSAVVLETLRLFPGPIVTPRILRKPLEIGGYEWPEGTTIVPCVQLTHHLENVYPDPWKFEPSRFLESKFSPAEFWPFGDGHRKCIGMQLAVMEMKLALFSIMREWNLEPCSKSDPKPVRRGGLIAPSSDMRLRVVSKRFA